ncbi:odorant receptor 33b-like [Rhopalosiphum maidis]|uniref:odorant receptor 33b-like n=1 Tax=Rhopalosiphum maidis TaxID=43146 RepID=UPI000F008116|nr:odorant receptor 33b-like [Rhopalosiphum maidis]
MEHQEVMKKYEMFLALFEKVMLMQILFSSLSLIILWVILLMIFFDDNRFVNSEVTTLQMVCLIPSYSFQIFMVCYLFGNLHNQKDSIIFALYSSNWTEMNINCKKMILFIIKMNNANYKKLKFTSTKIINLEMFFKTMGNCYTVISVLINQIKTKNE